jgi:hypothetical protein
MVIFNLLVMHKLLLQTNSIDLDWIGLQDHFRELR